MELQPSTSALRYSVIEFSPNWPLAPPKTFRRPPLAEPQRIDSADILPPAIAANWSRLGRSRLSAGIYARLIKMARRGLGWRGPGSVSLSHGSLRFFLEFWTIIRPAACEPQIALVPNGHLQAVWYRNSKRSLEIEFTETVDAFFGLFDGRTIIEGVDALFSLADMLIARESKPLKWR